MKSKKKHHKIAKTPAEVRKELREIVFEARKQKLAKMAAEASRKAISFSWDAVKSFVSDVKFKKEEQAPQEKVVSNKPKLEKINNEDLKPISYYDRWYNIVSKEKK
jgi:hypothetical protein